MKLSKTNLRRKWESQLSCDLVTISSRKERFSPRKAIKVQGTELYNVHY